MVFSGLNLTTTIINSNADAVSWWELSILASHGHPSVATMARTLLSGANIVYHGNPLQDFTLSSFLDKFMEKKAKKSTWHGASEIEPAKKVSILGQVSFEGDHLISSFYLILQAFRFLLSA